MTIQNYGLKLIKEGDLVCEPRLKHDHDFFKIWTPDFMESIVFFSASKDKYISSLNFFWQSIFHQREVNNQIQAEEIFTSTHLFKINNQEAKDKIKQCSPEWYKENHNLIPESTWLHVIWEDDKDLFILFEDDEMYYGWGWDTNF